VLSSRSNKCRREPRSSQKFDHPPQTYSSRPTQRISVSSMSRIQEKIEEHNGGTRNASIIMATADRRLSKKMMMTKGILSKTPTQTAEDFQEEQEVRRASTIEHIVIHGADVNRVNFNQRTLDLEDNDGKKTSRVQFPNKDELFQGDVLQYRLINIVTTLHMTTILTAIIMFIVGWNGETLEWTSSVPVETCKCIISICTIGAFGCTMVVRNQQHREFRYPRITVTLLMEYILILLHVPPFTSALMIGWWMDTCNIIVFVRFYILYEALRVRSPIWRLRRINFDIHGEPSKVTGFYYFKYSMSSNPLKFFACSSSVLMVCLSFSMLIFERWEQPDMDIRLCLYYMIIVFTSVGLGDVTCQTQLGRFVTIVAACTGFVFLSICVGFLFEAIEMEDVEMEIKENHLKIMALIEYRNYAAIIIQRWFRKYYLKKKGQIQMSPEHVKDKDKHTDFLISLNFSDAKESIQEQMMLANKQSVGHVARMTQSLVEKLNRDMEMLISRVFKMDDETVRPNPSDEVTQNHWQKIKESIRPKDTSRNKENQQRANRRINYDSATPFRRTSARCKKQLSFTELNEQINNSL